MKYTVKRTAVLACAALMIGSVSLAASTPKVQAMGLPNPIVTYDTYESVVKDAGFTPLYLTRDAGFSCYYLSLIGKKHGRYRLPALRTAGNDGPRPHDAAESR